MTGQSRKPLSFMEILESELRKSLRNELRDELRAELRAELLRNRPAEASEFVQERFELWLNAKFTGPARATTQATHPSANHRRHPYPARATDRRHPNPSSSAPSEVTPTMTATSASVTDSAPEPITESMTDSVTEPTPRIAHTLDAEDVAALEFFRRHGTALPCDFTQDELKLAFRRLALRFHPDRHALAPESERRQLTILFQETRRLSQRLERHLRTAQPATAA
ncbi:MAG: hypothetical protein NDI61_11640 [Bdellovibrionaceae bacterium]|nr:hypothetical protein [Pseudobdellovibrionaceae bacterium]